MRRSGPLISRGARGERDQHDDGHEVSGDHVGELRDRRLASLRLLDELDDLRKGGVASDRVARKVIVPFLLMLAPVTWSPAFFSTGMLSPVSMDSSTDV